VYVCSSFHMCVWVAGTWWLRQLCWARPCRVLQRLEPAGGTQAPAASATRSIRKLEDPMWTLPRETAAGPVVRRSAIRAGRFEGSRISSGFP